MPAPSPAMQGFGIHLRTLAPSDLDWLRRLYGSLRADEMALVPWPDAARQAFLDDQFRLQHLHFTRAYPAADLMIVTQFTPPAAARDIGRLYLDRSPPTWRLMEIALEPGARGRGIGTALMRWLQHAASAAGAQGIDLHVAHDNVRPVRLYRQLGYRDVASDIATHRRMLWHRDEGWAALK